MAAWRISALRASALVMASCVVACSSLLAFDDLKSAASDGGADGGADAALDAPGTSGGAAAPTDVIAGSILVTTLAGSVKDTFNAPVGIALDARSNGNLYVADSMNHRVRKLTPAGEVSTFVDGLGQTMGLAHNGKDTLFIADFGNQAIYSVPASASAAPTLLAGVVGQAGCVDGATGGTFNGPRDLLLDNGILYVADSLNDRIRSVLITTGEVESWTGKSTTAATPGTPPTDGYQPLELATFWEPSSLAGSSTELYIADAKNHRIRFATASQVSTLTGSTAGSRDGSLAAAQFNEPRGIARDKNGLLYVADTLNHAIRIVDATKTNGVITLAGKPPASGAVDGTPDVATFNSPSGVAVDDDLSVYVGDTGNNSVRKIYQRPPNELAVAWSAPANPRGAIDGYQVDAWAGDKVGSAPSSLGCRPKMPATSCIITGLTRGTTYTITVRAMVGGATVGTSAPITAKPQ